MRFRFIDAVWLLLLAFVAWVVWNYGGSPTVATVVAVFGVLWILVSASRRHAALRAARRALVPSDATPATLGIEPVVFAASGISVAVRRAVIAFFAVLLPLTALELVQRVVRGDMSVWLPIVLAHVAILWSLWRSEMKRISRVALYVDRVEAASIFGTLSVLMWTEIARVVKLVAADPTVGATRLLLVDHDGKLRATLDKSLRPFDVLESTVRSLVPDRFETSVPA